MTVWRPEAAEPEGWVAPDSAQKYLRLPHYLWRVIHGVHRRAHVLPFATGNSGSTLDYRAIFLAGLAAARTGVDSRFIIPIRA
jgi:hypothetical protein